MSLIKINGFAVQFSSQQFTAFVEEMPDNANVRAIRDDLRGSWFIHWEAGKLYGLPVDSAAQPPFGKLEVLDCADHLKFLSAAIVNTFPQVLPRYSSHRFRPFTFLVNDGSDLVDHIAAEMGLDPMLLNGFKIWKKYELDARLIEFVDGSPSIGIVMSVSTRWEIKTDIEKLSQGTINLQGLYAVRRNPEQSERRLVGKIASVKNGVVHLSEAYDDLQEIAAKDVALEGSKSSFSRCLKTILGNRYEEFDNLREREEMKLLTGPALEDRLSKVEKFFKERSPIQIGSDFSYSVVGRLRPLNTPQYRSVVVASPVEYCFDAAKTKRDSLAWRGLEAYGPYSRDTFPKKSPKIVVFFPDTKQGPVENFLRQFRDGITFSGASRYGGFGKTFGLVNPQFPLHRISWLENNNRSPAQVYRSAAEDYVANETQLPDAAIVIILDEHAGLPDAENPYLQTKAILQMAGIPVQEMRVSTISSNPNSLQYINQNIALSLYSKMNGTPWTVNHDLTINDEIVIGMGTSEISGSRFEPKQKFIGITTVFRGDGNYLLSNVSRECRYDEYPNELRNSTINILNEIKQRNGWRTGDTVRIVFHIYKPLRNIEVAEIIDESVNILRSEQNVEFAFLTVSHDHPFSVIDTAQPGLSTYNGKKGEFAPARGVVVQLGRFTRLLCTNGPHLIKRANGPLPEPLLLHLHPKSTYRDLQYLSEQVLRFTSLSWRSTLPARKPVTIYYSELIAELLARLCNPFVFLDTFLIHEGGTITSKESKECRTQMGVCPVIQPAVREVSVVRLRRLSRPMLPYLC